MIVPTLYIYIYVNMHIYIYTHIHTYTQTHTYIYIMCTICAAVHGVAKSQTQLGDCTTTTNI